MNMHRRMRIGIIGAGPAGLSAAETLKENGYTDVLILEKSDRVGGKCSSFAYEGLWFELGAGVISENNAIVRYLANKYGVKTAPVNFSEQNLYLDARTGIPLPGSTLRERLRLVVQGLKYLHLIQRFRRVSQPGLVSVEPELCVPFHAWASRYKMDLLAEELKKYFTGFGYGFFEHVPAAYVLKYYSWETILAFLRRKFYKFPNGIQHLWTTVAKQHDIRLHSTIVRVERTDVVRVTTDAQQYEFDALIITSPLDEALTFLDATREEQNLFSQIQWCDYRTFACRISGFPKKSGYVPGNMFPSRRGNCLFWYVRHPDKDLYTFYVQADRDMADADILQHFQMLIQPLGGHVESVEAVAHWKYFPHVTSAQMENGYFDRVEALQGKGGVFYAGELLNFSTVEQSAWYAKTLIERYFVS